MKTHQNNLVIHKSIFYVFLFIISFGVSFYLIPHTSFAHPLKKHKDDLENPLKNLPPGMIHLNSEKENSGEEFIQEENIDEKPIHEYESHSDGMHDSFRMRGTHDMSQRNIENMSKEERLRSRGRNIYLHMCVFCHGEDGNSEGAAVEYLYPWPRDFRNGIFKFRSTPTGTLPRDEDIYRAIIKGVPGTSMPAWGSALSPEDTWALVNLIKSFSSRFQNEQPGEKIHVPTSPPITPSLVARGKDLFTKQKCVDCHGESGRGDGKIAGSLKDAWKHAVFVHDITTPAYLKSGHTAKDIFRTLSTGLDGSPMGSFSHLPERDRWALVHYIRSRFVKELRKAESETDIYSYRIDGEIDSKIDSPIWQGIKATELIMRPLSARRDVVDAIAFSSLNNGKQLAIRLQWEDFTKNGFNQERQDYFPDGIAVQLALGDVTLHTYGHNEPFFGMGNRGKSVNIWHWKAGREKAIAAENDREYAGGVDMDTLIYGGMRNNPVAGLTVLKESEVEELNAEGFGTITPQPEDKQNVIGHGEWKDGVWTVVFIRDMIKAGEWDADLIRDDPVLVAFAVWDGEKEDRNGRKVISVWQRLNVLTEIQNNKIAKQK